MGGWGDPLALAKRTLLTHFAYSARCCLICPLLISAALLALSFEGSPSSSPAVAGLWGPWAQPALQLAILGGLVSVDADQFSFAALP